ncbi:aspartate aminotransferase family protein [Acuticoccus sediminis]|uniref:aspartate aminotransferase family protein n=1 Tax=Acuticoccus sediminis TaxID=2184697 RepID=UPI001CFF12C1|nr:aspartate aminotransferase family protein [Acuticoccus sediminis]
MSHVFHRTPARTLPRIVAAQGLRMTDADGRTYLDAVSGGAAVSSIGHGDPRITDAITAQLGQVAYAHNGFFTSDAAEELADTLIAGAPEGLSRVIYCSGGSEAIESALKLARQTFVERGQPGKAKVIARRQSYHGATMGALSIGGNVPRKAPYAPMLFDAPLIAPCYPYRDQAEGETLEAYAIRAADALEEQILAEGPETVAAFVAEPVVGATLGCVPAAPGYLKRIREICDRYDVLLVFDEVMCGGGRTGFAFACLEDGVSPDILVIAKGLGGGYQPIGAVLASQAIVDTIVDGSGSLKQGFTYMAHPVACAAALAVQKVIAEDGLVEAAAARGAQLRAGLDAAFGQHPHVGNIRGRGLFQGLEFVADRETKAPFDPSLAFNARLKANAFADGLMVYPMPGTIDGINGDHVVLAPAFVATAADIDEIVERLAVAIDRTVQEINA